MKKILDKLSVWQLTALLLVLFVATGAFVAVFTETAILILGVTGMVIASYVMAMSIKQWKE